jgi:diaminohydroxyphosphoribosylaminopyrimidine deaminase/5-amino-6-(5-phosphoribosylamino)uracil reductase
MSAFMHWCKNRRPHVLLKAATDSNGRIDGDPEKPAIRFSSKESLELVQNLRRDAMAILVGVNTVIRDNPRLTVRGDNLPQVDNIPKRIVIDPNNRIPQDSHLMTESDAETYLINTKKYDTSKDMNHVNRIILPSENGEINVEKILDCLGDLEIQTLLVEGGLNTWKRFLDSNLVNSAHLCVSKKILPGKSEAYFTNVNLENAGLKIVEKINLGTDKISRWE